MANICVYGLCKNMRHNIEEWLSNVSEADLIILLDLGSEDGSQEFIRCMMYYYPNLKYTEKEVNPFDYAEARNIALYAAEKHIVDNGSNLKDWVFVSLDLDERLSNNSFQAIRNIADNYQCDIIHVAKLHNDGICEGAGDNNRIHSSEFYWYRAVHESIKNPNKKKKDYNIFEYSGIEVYCLYPYDDTSRYLDNYRDLLVRSREKYDNDILSLVYLGELDKKEMNYSHLLAYGNEMNEILNNDIDNEFYNDMSMNVKAFYFMADFYHFIKDYEMEKRILLTATTLFTLFDDYDIRPRLLHYKLAKLYWDMGYYIDSIHHYKEILKINSYIENDIADDPTLYDNAAIYSELSNAYYYASENNSELDLYQEAYDAGTSAYMLDPLNETYKNNMLYLKDKI